MYFLYAHIQYDVFMNACTINVGAINAVKIQTTHFAHCLNVKAALCNMLLFISIL